MTKTMEENQAFVKAMHEVVAEASPDYVFEGLCRYFDFYTAEPLCMVGRALSKVGVEGPAFLSMKSENGGDYNSTGASKVLRMLGYDPRLAEAADTAQRIQDGRTEHGSGRGTWAAALDAFDQHLRISNFQMSTMD